MKLIVTLFIGNEILERNHFGGLHAQKKKEKKNPLNIFDHILEVSRETWTLHRFNFSHEGGKNANTMYKICW